MIWKILLYQRYKHPMSRYFLMSFLKIKLVGFHLGLDFSCSKNDMLLPSPVCTIYENVPVFFTALADINTMSFLLRSMWLLPYLLTILRPRSVSPSLLI